MAVQSGAQAALLRDLFPGCEPGGLNVGMDPVRPPYIPEPQCRARPAVEYCLGPLLRAIGLDELSRTSPEVRRPEAGRNRAQNLRQPPSALAGPLRRLRLDAIADHLLRARVRQ